MKGEDSPVKDTEQKEDIKAGEGASAAAGEEEVVPARYFVKPDRADHSENCDTLSGWEEDSAPTSDTDIQRVITENQLRHGDLVNFGDYRDTETYACVEEDGNLTLVQCEDDSAAGYLTITENILKNIPNFYTKYKKVIDNDLIFVNFRVSGRDGFLRSYLGDIPQEGWNFDVSYDSGELSTFNVKPAGNEKSFQEFNLEDTTWDDIVAFFDARAEGTQEIKVKVKLEGDDFQKYKDQHSTDGRIVEWMAATPDLPSGWRCERGQSGGGATRFHWDWLFEGPVVSRDVMKANIDTFLEDYVHQYVED